jgi:hypothetical protein
VEKIAMSQVDVDIEKLTADFSNILIDALTKESHKIHKSKNKSGLLMT